MLNGYMSIYWTSAVVDRLWGFQEAVSASRTVDVAAWGAGASLPFGDRGECTARSELTQACKTRPLVAQLNVQTLKSMPTLVISEISNKSAYLYASVGPWTRILIMKCTRVYKEDKANICNLKETCVSNTHLGWWLTSTVGDHAKGARHEQI